MAVDRSKLKATNMSKLKDQEKELNKKIGKSSRVGFLDIDKGWNKFRIYPAHPDHESFIVASAMHWMPVELKDEDGETKEIKRLPIFNSKVHGGTPKDIIEEYVEYVKNKKTLEIKDKTKLDKALYPLLNWKTGCKVTEAWILYADKYNESGEKEFGRLQITTGTKNKIEELTLTEGSDEPIIMDPFTDPDEGVAIILTYNPNAKDKNGGKDLKNFYKVALESKKKGLTITMIPTPLTDSDVKNFLDQDSLSDVYVNSYKRKDFEKALRGCKILDEEHGYEAFEDDEWLKIVEEIDSYYPEDEESTVEESPLLKETPIVVEEDEEEMEEVEEAEEVEETEEEGDKFDEMTRNQLKIYNRDELGGAIVVKKSYDDDQIRDLIREHEAALNAEVEEINPEEVEEAEVLEEQEEPFEAEEQEEPTPTKKVVSKKETPKKSVKTAAELRELLKGKK